MKMLLKFENINKGLKVEVREHRNFINDISYEVVQYSETQPATHKLVPNLEVAITVAKDFMGDNDENI